MASSNMPPSQRYRLKFDDIFATYAENQHQQPSYSRQDLLALRNRGYLKLPIPREFGGFECDMKEVMFHQRKLAFYSSSLALGLGCHFSCVGSAAEGWRLGDKSLEWILLEAAAGKVFTCSLTSISHWREPDQGVLVDSLEDGILISGVIPNCTLEDSWSYLYFQGTMASPDNNSVIQAFLPRDSQGYCIVPTKGINRYGLHQVDIQRVFIPNQYLVTRELGTESDDHPFHLSWSQWNIAIFLQFFQGVLDSDEEA